MKQYTFALLTMCVMYTMSMLALSQSNFEEKKEVVLILGTGRCGSSCLAGVLNIMGLDFGDENDLFPPDKYNEKGSFENKHIDKLLTQLFKIMDMLPLHSKTSIIDWKKEDNIDFLKKLIKQCIEENFVNRSKFGIKKNRIILFLPCFIKAFQELGYSVKLITILRDPEEVINSYQVNSIISKENQYKNLTRILTSFLYERKGYDNLIVLYNDLLSNPKKVIEEIHMFLPWLKDYEHCSEEIDNFVDVNLKHF